MNYQICNNLLKGAELDYAQLLVCFNNTINAEDSVECTIINSAVRYLSMY